VTITRDDWGIAHIKGRTDADAVFGAIYAQAEDDFNRIETNYLVQLGRLAEAEGEKAIWQDLRMRLFNDPADLQARYASSPDWLKRLMVAWADGLNHYLATHPETRPRVLTRFDPWMALSFTEGSIGADFERVSLAELEAFYGNPRKADLETPRRPELVSGSSLTPTPVARWMLKKVQHDEIGVRQKDPTGSNGIAIAPAKTANGKALLLINPHTSFFFRSEQQMTSEEGLNAYGASTWGQFFIYQGFNDRLGWMHTTSGLDAVDEFAESIVPRGDRLFYRYGAEFRPVQTRTIAIPYRMPDGTMASRSFVTYRTHHGPIVRAEGGKWISIALMHRPVEALSQGWLRTKARNFAGYQAAMQYRANSSNNTIYADADGTIAYLHPQFIPVRGDRFDYTRPVDGSDPRTDWRGLHAVADAPSVTNPGTGWIQNTNNWPYSAAGPDSPRPIRFRATWTRSARMLAASTRPRCFKAAPASRSIGLSRLPTTRTSPPLRRRSRHSLQPMTDCRARTHSETSSPGRSRLCAAGTIAGTSRPCRPASPSSGRTTCSKPCRAMCAPAATRCPPTSRAKWRPSRSCARSSPRLTGWSATSEAGGHPGVRSIASSG
jgi:acyl-homoserine-lactone acylase